MLFKASKKYEMAVAHKLTSSSSVECQRIHGHNYELEVVVCSHHLDTDGMVMDFKDLDKIVAPIVDKFDHSYLEQGHAVKYNPTAENMAMDIMLQIRKILEESSTVLLHSVKLWETRKCSVEIII